MNSHSQSNRHKNNQSGPALGLQLDAEGKSTLQELFLTAAQVPSLGLENATLTEDAGAVFRVAREFSAEAPLQELRRVSARDLVRTLRFICWLLSYETDLSKGLSRKRRLQQFFASVVLQAQSQYSGFEVLLSEYGLDRQLENQLAENSRATGNRERQDAGVRLAHRTSSKQVQIRVGAQGAEMISSTTESTWTADGWKNSSR